jgi:uncharacterized damage-inducible protein DinB
VTRIAVEELLKLLDEGYEGDDEHSLIGNLRTVREQDWAWVAEGGRRSIRDIVVHAGAAKHLYDDHAFRGGTLRWNRTVAAHMDDSMAAAIAWMREGHTRLCESVAKLDDSELSRPRKSHWCEPMETRRLISIMIQHDLYHAGEINHLRALRQDDDAWPGA